MPCDCHLHSSEKFFLEIQVNTNCFDAFWEILCNLKIHVQGIDI